MDCLLKFHVVYCWNLRFLYFEGEVGGLAGLVGLRMILDVGCDVDRKEAVAGGVGCGGGGFADQLW